MSARTAETIYLVSPLPFEETSTSGVSKHAHILGNALVDSGTRVVIVAQAGCARLSDARYEQVEVWHPGFSSFLDILTYLREESAQYVSVQHEMFMYGKLRANLSFLAMLAACRMRGVRIFTTMYHAMTKSELNDMLLGGEYTNRPMIPLFVAAVKVFNFLAATIGSGAIVCHPASVAAFPIPCRGRVRDVPLIAPVSHVASGEIERVREGYGLPAGYVLGFGFLSRYKGIELMIEAAEALEGTVDFVVVAGKNVRQAEKTQYLSYYYGLKKRAEAVGIRWLDYVPERDVEPLFAGAKLFVAPYVTFHGSSGPLSIAAALDVPTLVTRVMRMEAFSDVAIPATGAGVVRGITRFFEDPAYGERVRAGVARYIQARSAGAVAADYRRILVGDAGLQVSLGQRRDKEASVAALD